MSQVTTAITLADAIALFGSVVNDRITIHTSPYRIAWRKKNAMQGKVFKVYPIGSIWVRLIATKKSVMPKARPLQPTKASKPTLMSSISRMRFVLCEGAGEHVSGAIVRCCR